MEVVLVRRQVDGSRNILEVWRLGLANELDAGQWKSHFYWDYRKFGKQQFVMGVVPYVLQVKLYKTI